MQYPDRRRYDGPHSRRSRRSGGGAPTLTLLLHLAAASAAILSPAAAIATTPAPDVLIVTNAPLLFAYGTWEKRVQVADGETQLDAAGMTPKGGGGANVNLDLRRHAPDLPALRLRVGPHNTLKTLRLMLRDTDGHTGTWDFPLPTTPTTGDILLPAKGDALFSHPATPENSGPLNLATVMQWQLMGDWGGDGPVDVQVKEIVALAPGTDLFRQRAALAAREQAAQTAQIASARAAAREKYRNRTALTPVVEAVYAAAPDILALRIHSGKTLPSHLTPYTPQPGDQQKSSGGVAALVRGGQEIGWLIGPKRDALVTYEGFQGDPLLTAEADDPESYRIRSANDPAYVGAGVRPQEVFRKSKPDDWEFPGHALPMSHIVYLRLPHPLSIGKRYTISLGAINVQTPSVSFVFDPAKAWSESVHVSQVGFRPDDPVKRAYLSLWMGSGGGYGFPAGLPFRIVTDDAARRTVYQGRAGSGWAAERPEKMSREANFNGTAVYPLDFTAVTASGRYRVVVEGVGCSYPFEIGPTAWEKAFQVQMKGFYNQRSGVALGPPYTAFRKPRDFYPGDGAPVYQSTYSHLDGGDGLKQLEARSTGKPVPEAWGGYHDAGDWNPRRITHMRTTTFWQLELLDLFPAYFRRLSLNIPRPAPVPDLLNECRFELSLFQRLQLPDGSVRFGIETNGDPYDGEVSWKQSMPAYVYAPDIQSTYIYTAVAARAAQVLATYDPAESKRYRESALRAMRWAEADRTRRQTDGSWQKLSGEVTDDRDLAAVCLYALTADAHWNAVFLQDTALKGTPPPFRGSLQQRDTAFTYARLPQRLGDPAIKQNALRALVADADGSLAYERENAWGIASDDPGKPQFLGFYSNPHGGVSLLRAYHLTHDRKYLAGAVQACLFPAGANPSNMVYTSGVGSNPVRHPLNLDSRHTGQPTPEGITVYGNVDLGRWGDQTWITWPITYYLKDACRPSPYEWPTTEAYFDIFLMPALDEFTMDQTMGPNAYVWGFLAARK